MHKLLTTLLALSSFALGQGSNQTVDLSTGKVTGILPLSKTPATTIGGNVFTLTNPSAITFPRFNANNTVDALSAVLFRAAIGAGTGSGDALVASPLSQFAPTTSAQLAGVVSDETGFSSGAKAVFSISPTITGTLTANHTAASRQLYGNVFTSAAGAYGSAENTMRVTNLAGFQTDNNYYSATSWTDPDLESQLTVGYGNDSDGMLPWRRNGYIEMWTGPTGTYPLPGFIFVQTNATGNFIRYKIETTGTTTPSHQAFYSTVNQNLVDSLQMKLWADGTTSIGNGTLHTSILTVGGALGSTINLNGATASPTYDDRPGLYHRDGVGLGVFSDAAISFQVNGAGTLADALRIGSNGKVGVGNTTLPSDFSVGSIGTVKEVAIGMQDTLARLREREAVNDFTITTNLSSTPVQDDAAKSSWRIKLGATSDSFSIARSPAGSTTLATLFDVAASGAITGGTYNGSTIAPGSGTLIGTGNLSAITATGTLTSGALGAGYTIPLGTVTLTGNLPDARNTVSNSTTTTMANLTTVGALVSGTFTTDWKSTTALATPSALSATQFSSFASTVSGASIMGYGTTNDVTLRNRAGVICLGVGPNTTVINIPSSAVSTASNNGALVVSGGVGIGGSSYVAGDFGVGNTLRLGTTGYFATELFWHNRTRIGCNTTDGQLQIQRSSGAALAAGSGIILGPATSSGAKIEVSGTAITACLGDGTAGGSFTASGTLAVTGNATFSGDLIAATVGKGLQIKSGTGQRAGNATLVGGTVTVSNTTVTANTLVNLTRKTSGGTIGTAITYTLSAASGFTINSDNPLDTSTFTYLLIELN